MIIMRSFFKIPELAKRWGKTEDEILHMLEADLMPSYFWYEGYVESILRMPGKRYHYKGFVQTGRNIPFRLLLSQDASITYLCPYSEPFGPDKTDSLIPMELSHKDTLEYISDPISVHVTDLVVMSHDVDQLEEFHPELTEKNSLQLEPSIPPVQIVALPVKAEPEVVVKTDAESLNSATLKENEKPLMGRKAIAGYLNVSVSAIKNYKNEKRFSYFKQGGLICAYPSQLDAWRQSKNKK
jgi:hypothetical protein